MLRPTAYALLRNGFVDWEAASALAELQRTFGYSVKTIGLSSETTVSMGGFIFSPPYFAAAAPAIVYFPEQEYSNPPSAVPVVLQVPDPLMPFIFPVPPVI